MYEDVHLETHVSVMVDCYCCPLDSGATSSDEIKVYMDICCIYIPFDKAWFVQLAQYCLTSLYFEVRARRMHHDSFSCVLVGEKELSTSQLDPKVCPFYMSVLGP